jgi:hypothetical protein
MTGAKSGRLPFYYGWVIVATGALCMVACLGFGRFALVMLLPSMAATLELAPAVFRPVFTWLPRWLARPSRCRLCWRHRAIELRLAA